MSKLKTAIIVAFFVMVSLPTWAQSTLRAVIIGVSQYENFDENRQLKFAHRDAQDFYKMIKTGILGPIDEENVNLLMNKGAVEDEAMFLIKEALIGPSVKEGDKTIIYFAGHGDVHADNGNGFLLTYHAPSDGDYFLGGAIELKKLTKYIEAGAEKGVKTVLITDACRSGSLVSKLGSQMTLQALASLHENSLQMLSCGADQSSQESERWGGGHGVFTYYLIQGLSGEADEDQDDVIRFFELNDYVRKKVRSETEFRQIPKGMGKDIARVAEIDPSKKDILLRQIKEEDPGNGESIWDRYTSYMNIYDGMLEDQVQGRLNDDFQKKVELFKSSLRAHKIMRPGSYYAWKANEKINLGNISLDISIEKEIGLHDTMAMAMALSQDGRYLATASDDSTIKLVNTQSLQVEKTLRPHWGGVLAVAFSEDDKKLVSGSWDETVRIIDIASGETKHKLEGHEEDIRGVDFNPKASLAVSVGIDGKVIVWNASTGEKTLEKDFPGMRFNAVDWLPGNSGIAVADENGYLLLLNLSDLSIRHKKKVGGENLSMGVRDDGKILYAGSEHGVSYYTLPELKKMGSIQFPTRTRRLYPWGKYVAVPTDDAVLLLNSSVPSVEGIVNYTSSTLQAAAYQENTNKLYFTDKEGNFILAHVAEKLKDKAPFAFDLYRDLIQDEKVDRRLEHRLKGRLAMGCELDAQKVINKISHNDKMLPPKQKIAFAIEELELALELVGDDPVMQDELNAKLFLLKGYEILVVNDREKFPQAIDYFEQINKYEPSAAYQYDAIGRTYQKTNDLDKSKENLKEAKERVPVWTTPRTNLGQTYYREGNFKDAMNEYNAIVELKPESPKGYTGLGDIHYSMGNLEEASQYYEVSSSKDTSNPYIYNKMGDVEAKRGNIKAARQNYSKSMKLDSNYAANYVDMAKISEDEDSAKTYIQKAEQLTAYDSEAYIDIAEYYSTSDKEEDLKKSQQLYKKSLQLDPYNRKAYDGLTDVYLKKGEEDEAEKVVKEAEKAMPEKSHTHYLMANYYKKTNQKEEAQKHYKQAIDKSPSYYDAYVGLMDMYKEDPDANKEEATQLFQQADTVFGEQHSLLQVTYAKVNKEFKPHTVEVPAYANSFAVPEQEVRTVSMETAREDVKSEKFKSLLGEQEEGGEAEPEIDFETVAFVHTVFGEYYEAEQYLQKVLEEEGPSTDVYLSLGEVEAKRGRVKEALNYYAEASELNPEMATPYVKAAALVKDSATKWQLINKAENASQQSYEDWADIGFFYLKDRKDYKSAKKAFANSRKRNPYYEEAIYGFAEMYRMQGDEKDSREEMENAINALPMVPEPYYLMAKHYKSLGKQDKAEEFYRRALSKEEYFLKSYIGLIELEADRDFKEAQRYYVIASDKFPESSELHATYAQALIDKGKYDEAEEVLKKGIAHDVNYVENYRLLLKVYQQKNKSSLANKIAEKKKDKGCSGCAVDVSIGGTQLKGVVEEGHLQSQGS